MKKLFMILLMAGSCFAATTTTHAQGAGAGNKQKKDPVKHCTVTLTEKSNRQGDRGAGSAGGGGYQRQGD